MILNIECNGIGNVKADTKSNPANDQHFLLIHDHVYYALIKYYKLFM